MPVPQLISMVLFAMVAFIASTMAWKGLTAPGLLPFHETAAGRPADTLTTAERSVAVALTRSLGLGFAVAALALVAAVAGAAVGDRWMVLGLGGVALVFCGGLAAINRRLETATSTSTPWKGALYAAVAIAAGLAFAMA
jgi:hypothetical protein